MSSSRRLVRLACWAALVSAPVAGFAMLFYLLASMKNSGNVAVEATALFWLGMVAVVLNLRAAFPWPLEPLSSRAARGRKLALGFDVLAIPAAFVLAFLLSRQPSSDHEFRVIAFPILTGLPLLFFAVLARRSLTEQASNVSEPSA